MLANEAAYYEEALRLREKYSSQIKILIGFEIEWIRPVSSALVHDSLSRYPFEFFIGSVHHMHTEPIDYDHPMYERAREKAGGTDERLFEDYFDAQFEMLTTMKPLVVGHFDLIRLKSDDPERSFRQWKGVWEKILRNLEFVAAYGGMLELNSAALRKGMSEPYPKGEICKVCPYYIPLSIKERQKLTTQEFLSLGGRFCLSDDSHGIDQVGLNFHRVLDFVETVGISTLHYLQLSETDADTASSADGRFPRTQVASIGVSNAKALWTCTPVAS